MVTVNTENRSDGASLQQEQLAKLEKEFLELRLAKHTGQVKNVSRFKKVRAEIARLKLSMSSKR